MLVRNGNGFGKKCAQTIAGKGLFLALALAAAAFQGCTTADKASGPSGTDTPSAPAIAENAKGEDLNPDGSLVNPDNAGAAGTPAGLAKLAPDCVDVATKGGWTRSATAWNHCKTRVRIRFIWAFGGDGACTQLYMEDSHTESRQWPSYFAEIHSC